MEGFKGVFGIIFTVVMKAQPYLQTSPVFLILATPHLLTSIITTNWK
jgi:hypothetical protein